MAEYEVDLFLECPDIDNCDYSPEEPTTINGEDGSSHEWTCPGCGKTYLFEVVYEPEISNMRSKSE
ncbi:hypothetical protein F0267_01635 [Vibrio coralliilyticus]|uniref:Uncharacterized protein n=2 Tax=Vibrio TaxID=662 RepID=A0AAN0W063_9VIBR|nr:hypothetical protein [Vibrio coralliilyticus]CAH1588442.1 conserved hypothetical protein [Vibrio jasicida]AIW22370.1 hypothetical protein IX92_25200 [Vibrio coralliilyticus]NOH36925.1 hypothetical protein [Vibrio coralliilyticus]PAW02441.1 hypothetical protein CKJ79_17405 [Vibrio coralliilyticus]CAH1599816.1 conserved hypothetical protein [Vibrio jasicida]